MRLFSAIAVLTLLFSCSTQQVTTEISEKGSMESLKRTGILFRVPLNTSLEKTDMEKNLMYWFAAYKQKSELVVIIEAPEKISGYNAMNERFYQLSDSNTFLKYKSMGAILLYTSENEEGLKNIFAENSLDSLIIYEVDTNYSMELQYYDYQTLIAAFNPDLKMIYMDHNTHMVDTDELDPEKAKSGLLDNINNRLLNTLADMGLVDKK